MEMCSFKLSSSREPKGGTPTVNTVVPYLNHTMKRDTKKSASAFKRLYYAIFLKEIITSKFILNFTFKKPMCYKKKLSL